MPDSLSVMSVMEKDILTAKASITASGAGALMAERAAGSIVITDGARPIGIFTERDMMNLVVVQKKNPDDVLIGDVMTRDVVSIGLESTLEDAYEKMMDGNFRHLLVIDDGSLVGIISIRDLVRIRDQILERRVKEKTHRIIEVQKKLSESMDAIRRDMALASAFQKELVVKKYPRTDRIHFSHVYEQADSIGGDFFEVAEIDQRHLGVLMVDVMGHGITSAMIAIEMKMKFDQVYPGQIDPSPVITKLNRQLIRLMPTGFFVAGFYGVINLDSLEMNYVQFGLPRPFLLRGKSGNVDDLPHGHVPIGIRGNTEYTSRNIGIKPGDSLLLFTDGCTEQKGANDRMYGEERFISLFKRLKKEAGDNIPRQLYGEVLLFAGDVPINDDVAILLCEFPGD